MTTGCLHARADSERHLSFVCRAFAWSCGFISSLTRDTYTEVVRNEVCPNASWTTRRFVPFLACGWRRCGVRFPSPAPGSIRRYTACKAKAAEGRPPAFQAGRRGWLIAGGRTPNPRAQASNPTRPSRTALLHSPSTGDPNHTLACQGPSCCS